MARALGLVPCSAVFQGNDLEVRFTPVAPSGELPDTQTDPLAQRRAYYAGLLGTPITDEMLARLP